MTKLQAKRLAVIMAASEAIIRGGSWDKLDEDDGEMLAEALSAWGYKRLSVLGIEEPFQDVQVARDYVMERY